MKNCRLFTGLIIFLFIIGLFATCAQPSNGDFKHGGSSGNTYTVVYNKNASAATGIMADSIFKIGSPEKLRINSFVRTGFNFVGWATSASGSVKYENGEIFYPSVTGGSTVVLYAVWEEPTVIVPGVTLVDKLEWLALNAVSGEDYTIIVDNSPSITPQYLFYPGRNNIKIRLKGDNAMRTISLASQGSLFKVGSGVSLVLDNNITLWGLNNNNAVLVYVETEGNLRMNTGSIITRNKNSSSFYNRGGGVYVGGDFSMFGGTISGNTAGTGGGVYVDGSFTMSVFGGTISGNTASAGGGVYVSSGRLFSMFGGTISGNTASGDTSSTGRGGGLYFDGGSFYMGGGTIIGNNVSNTALYSSAFGGGVCLERGGSFSMTGGTISGNAANGVSCRGGGVYIGSSSFNKTGGTIYGYSVGDSNSNVIRNGSVVYDNLGHAVSAGGEGGKKKDFTSGPTDNLSYNGRVNPPVWSGEWDF